jgi:hypothetical protein
MDLQPGALKGVFLGYSFGFFLILGRLIYGYYEIFEDSFEEILSDLFLNSTLISKFIRIFMNKKGDHFGDVSSEK